MQMTSQRVYHDGEFGIKTVLFLGLVFLLFSSVFMFKLRALFFFINAYAYSWFGDVSYILPFMLGLFFILKQQTYRDSLKIASEVFAILAVLCFLAHYFFEFSNSDYSGGIVGFWFIRMTKNIAFYLQYDANYLSFFVLLIAFGILIFYLYFQYVGDDNE